MLIKNRRSFIRVVMFYIKSNTLYRSGIASRLIYQINFQKNIVNTLDSTINLLIIR